MPASRLGWNGQQLGKGNLEMQQDPRIDRMYSGDRFWSLASLLLLWILYAFVFLKMLPFADAPEVFWLLVVGGAMVLLFNTAAIIAMISHLSDVREEVYGLDLRYLDAAEKMQKS
jgi:hypothetical protein